MARTLSALPALLSQFRAFRPPLRAMHRYAIRHRPSMRAHPFDAAYGVSTTGYLPWWLLRGDSAVDRDNAGYAGCQPSCLRRALSMIPNPSRFAFLDVGCGMGRAAIIASEFPFSSIHGIELAPHLVAIARRNAAIVRRAYPDRPSIDAAQGDAMTAPLPAGDLVVFLYHPFGRSRLEQFLDRLLRGSASSEVFIIYENPEHGDVLDTVPGLRRWHAATVDCDPAERNCAPTAYETVVTWQWRGDRSVPPVAGADASIIVKPNYPPVLGAASVS